MKQMINRIREKIKNSQLGSATIEAVVAFTGFLFVIFTILNIVNICRAQMLVSNAVDTVTKELTQYSYFYEISGLQKFENEIHAISEDGDLDLNTIASAVGNLYTALGNGASSSEAEMRGLANSLQEGTLSSTSINTALQNVDTQKNEVLAAMESMEAQMEGLPDNPVVYLKSIVAVAGSQGLDMLKSHAIASPLAKSLMVKHFGDNRAEANAALERLGVVDGLNGMNFNMSTIFQKEHRDEIHLAVYYKVKVVQLFKWADFEATICKETRARAWLGGDDVQYRVVSAISDSGSTGGDEAGGSGESSPVEGDDEEGSEDDEDSDSHTGDIGLEEYPADVRADIIEAIKQKHDTSDWTEEQWREAVNGIPPVIIVITEPTATPTPTEAPQATATPVPTEAPQATATPVPTETPQTTATPVPTETPQATATPTPTATPASSVTFTSWEQMKDAYPRHVWAYIHENKPMYSPDIEKWFEKGGTITIEENAEGDKIWTYTSPKGVSVPYINGYIKFPDQYLFPTPEPLNIGKFTDSRKTDKELALELLAEMGINEIPKGYVLHHDTTNGVLLLVKEEIHTEFTHIGGHSMYGKDEGE